MGSETPVFDGIDNFFLRQFPFSPIFPAAQTPAQPQHLSHQHSLNLSKLEFNNSLDNEGEVENLSLRDIMKYWFGVAIVLLFLRQLVERCVFQPIGKRLGIKDKQYTQVKQIPCGNPSAILTLETKYVTAKGKNFGKENHNEMLKFSELTGMEVREVERWMRRRKALDKPSKLTKFNESGWRFICYLISTAFGIAVLWNKPWFLNMFVAWDGYPHKGPPNDIFWYYVYGGGLYAHFLMSQAFDVKRKDFWEMLVHHLVTAGLLISSFELHLTRFGVITLFIHDCSDGFLESAKMANYAKRQNLSTGIFVIFTLVWIATRLIFFPWKIIYEANIPMKNYVPSHLQYTILSLLLTLFCLHLFWTYFIGKVALSALRSGPENNKDARSDTETDSTETEEENVETFPSNEEKLQNKPRHLTNRRFSLQYNQGASLLAKIECRQRIVMKRISLEIM